MTDQNLVERLRSSVTYAYMPMAVRRQLDEAAARIESLEARLEVVPGESESVDDIACRDETIRLQDERIARLLARIESLTAELAELKKWAVGHWFYDVEDPERAFYGPDEVIDYADLEPGHHVIEVAVSASLPSIWCAVRVTDDDDADERLTFTEHASEDEARQALSAYREGGE